LLQKPDSPAGCAQGTIEEIVGQREKRATEFQSSQHGRSLHAVGLTRALGSVLVRDADVGSLNDTNST
jgi:hypothetical protein